MRQIEIDGMEDERGGVEIVQGTQMLNAGYWKQEGKVYLVSHHDKRMKTTRKSKRQKRKRKAKK